VIRLLLALVLATLAVASPARADDNRPLTLSLEHEGNGAYRALWKVPANVEARHLPAIAASGCTAQGNPRNWSDSMGHWHEESWRCADGLGGQQVAITYPLANPNLAAIVRYTAQPGADPQTILLQPQDTAFSVPRAEEGGSVFADFLVLGVEHILIGLDHLLFVAGLILIARTPRRILTTITGFTIAHSITLALAALDVVQVPIKAVEVVIALSIVFLAVEVVKGERDTLVWRKPILVAIAFGLLHGFGFAAVLQEIGLPQGSLVTALLAFNLGIELGQIAFAAVVFGAIAMFEGTAEQRRRMMPVERMAGYGVGVLASTWMFQRLF